MLSNESDSQTLVSIFATRGSAHVSDISSYPSTLVMKRNRQQGGSRNQ